MSVISATQAVKIAVTNPAPYERAGVAAVPWSDVLAHAPSLTEDSVEVTYYGTRVPSQVDAVEKRGTSRMLVFSLPLPAGDEHYRDPTTSVVVRAAEDPPRPPHAQIAKATGNGVRLANGLLDVWFSTKARPWDDERKWFAGAASTVQIEKREFLDANAGFAWEGHDPEKRAMQIDRVRIWRPPWDEYEPAYCDFPMHDSDFELIACGAGPVRAWCTIASTAFDFDFGDLSEARRRAYNCRLYRTISLFAGSDFVFEELHVQATPDGFQRPRISSPFPRATSCPRTSGFSPRSAECRAFPTGSASAATCPPSSATASPPTRTPPPARIRHPTFRTRSTRASSGRPARRERSNPFIFSAWT
jgi:hypothetical protein